MGLAGVDGYMWVFRVRGGMGVWGWLRGALFTRKQKGPGRWRVRDVSWGSEAWFGALLSTILGGGGGASPTPVKGAILKHPPKK